MKPTNLLFALPLAALSLGGLLLTGCAVQQPIAGRSARNSSLFVKQEQSNSAMTTSVFAAKRVQAKPSPEPQPLVAAEPLPEPQAAAEPAPESQPKIAAEPAPKKRGPLTRAEENEIDNQVMP